MSGRPISGRDDSRDRDARLARALRENLRRRKAQARRRRDPEPDEPPAMAERQGGQDRPREE